MASHLIRCKFDSVKRKINASSLFAVAQDVLNHAILASGKCFLGKQEQVGSTCSSNPVSKSTCPLSNLERSANKVGGKAVNSVWHVISKILVENCLLGKPKQVDMSILKRIVCKVECEATVNEETVKSVLEMLPDSEYSWAEKAVLTLAAFASVYGEHMFYVDSRQLNEFASSISSLRRVDVLIGHTTQDQKFQQAFAHLNTVTKTSMQMIACMLEFEKLSKNLEYDTHNQISDLIKDHSSLVIQSLIDCMAQVICLNDNGVPELELFGRIPTLKEKLKEEDIWHEKISDAVKRNRTITAILAATAFGMGAVMWYCWTPKCSLWKMGRINKQGPIYGPKITSHIAQKTHFNVLDSVHITWGCNGALKEECMGSKIGCAIIVSMTDHGSQRS